MEIGPPKEHIDICRFDEHITPNRGLSEILRHGSGPQRYFSPTVQDTLTTPFLTLPGTGEPGSLCGDDLFFWCRDCAKLFEIPEDCGERQCPHCNHIWARNEARIMRGRLWDGRRYYYRAHGKRFRLHHCIISYSMEIPTCGEAYRDLKRHAIHLAKEAGIDGGCLVFHPWREDRDKHQFDIVGPHFHIFGIGKWIKPADELNRDPLDSVIFKRVRDFNARQRDPFNYVLTHCGIPQGGHAVIWFGLLAYNKMPRGEEERAAREERDARNQICTHCGGDNTSYVPVPYKYEPHFWIEPKEM